MKKPSAPKQSKTSGRSSRSKVIANLSEGWEGGKFSCLSVEYQFESDFQHEFQSRVKSLTKKINLFSRLSLTTGSNFSIHQFNLSSFQPSHSPSDLYNDSKGSKNHGPFQRYLHPPIPERLAHQGPVS